MSIAGKQKLESVATRADIKTYLDAHGWPDLSYSEGWEEIDIVNPLVNIYIVDLGPDSLGLGKTNERLFDRQVQIDIYMESEDRVRALQDDVVEWMDRAISIKDIDSTVIGSLICKGDETIVTALFPPSLVVPELVRWRGVIRGDFDAHYPNG